MCYFILILEPYPFQGAYLSNSKTISTQIKVKKQAILMRNEQQSSDISFNRLQREGSKIVVGPI